MKTLFERVKPEILQLIESEREVYPYSVNYLVNELKTNLFVNDLKYACIIQLEGYYYTAYRELPCNGWSFFKKWED